MTSKYRATFRHLFTANLGEGSAFEDGSLVRTYYLNQNRDEVAYEFSQDQYSFYGNQGYDTVRLPASLEEFIVDQNTDTDGTTYTHIGSGNSYFIHNSVEEVILTA